MFTLLPLAAVLAMPPSQASCGRRHDVSLRAHDLVLSCETFRQCHGELNVDLINCSARPVELRRAIFEIWSEPGYAYRRVKQWSVDFAAATFVVPRWQRRRFHGTIRGYGEIEVTAEVFSGGRRIPVATVEAHATNPLWNVEVAKCTTCNGDWGRHGLSGEEGCNCRTKDARRVCRDGADCEGECIFDHFETLPSPSPPSARLPERAWRGSLVGRCSEFRTVWSCAPVIPIGASKEPPLTLPIDPPPRCLD